MTMEKMKSLQNSIVSVTMLAMITAVSPLAKFILLWLLCALLFCIVSSSTMEPESKPEPEPEPEPEPDSEYEYEYEYKYEPMSDHAKHESDESPETFLFKIKYEKTLKRLNMPIYDGNLHFDMEELRGRITYIFGLPRYSTLEISYIDEDGELITMTDENDLMDIMTQKKLQYSLRMYVKLINNETTKQAGVQAELEAVCTASDSGSLDDFFVYELL